ncbi:MAG TPA: hypothetical protein VGH10_08565 [Actinomycetota bacterium]
MVGRTLAIITVLLILAVPLGAAPTIAAPGSGGGCETAWTLVPAPRPDRGIGFLTSVTVVSANEAWAAGLSSRRDFTHEQPLFEHWDGAAWSIVPSPSLAGDAGINDIAAVASDDVWAVGSGPEGVLVEHWDGDAWHVVSAPSQNAYTSLHSLSATSADDVWASGTIEYHRRASDPLVEHWDGTTWSVAPVPPSPKQAERLFGVAATSSNDVWVGGQAYPGNGVFTATLVLHWDGSAWTRVDNPNPAIHGFNVFYDLAAVSSDDVWAVGTTSNNRPLTEQWDGTRWRIVDVSVAHGEQLGGVAAARSTDVRATGDFPLLRPVVMGWDGTRWSEQPTPPTPKSHAVLLGIAFGAGVYWAVGWTGMSHKTAPIVERACAA